MNTIALKNSGSAYISGYEVRATKKREHLDEFKALLRELYESDERMRGFKENPSMDDQHYSDPDNHVILAFDEGRVIGGLRMRISSPEYPLVLDMERDIICPFGKDRLHMQDLFPEYDLKNYAYAEVGWVTAHPDYRDSTLLQSLLAKLVEVGERYHVRYVFAYGNLIRLRKYRQLMKNMEQDIRIRMDLPPLQQRDPEGDKMYMMCVESRLFRLYGDEYAMNVSTNSQHVPLFPAVVDQ